MTGNFENFAIAVWGSLGLLGAWFAGSMLVKMSAEYFRQDLFNIRDDLFLLMADGEILPTDPAYTGLRSGLNSMIFFAERAKFWRLIRDAVMFRKEVVSAGREFDRRMAMVEDVTLRSKLLALHWRASGAMLSHFKRTSPLLWLVVFPAVTFVRLLKVVLVPFRNWILRFEWLRRQALLEEAQAVVQIEGENRRLLLQGEFADAT